MKTTTEDSGTLAPIIIKISLKKKKKKKRERSELYGKIKRFYKPYGDFMSVFVSFLAETVDLWLLE